MPLNVRSEEVNQLAEKLAARKKINKTEAVKLALENELRRLDQALPLRERLRPLQKRVLSRPETGLEADKASLIAALSDGAISPEAGRRALAAQPEGGWRDVRAFLDQPALKGLARPPVGQLAVRSRYYELTAQVTFGGGEVLMTSLIEQQAQGPAALRARRWTADE